MYIRGGRGLRDCIFGKIVTQGGHEGMNSRPVVLDALTVLVSHNHGHAQVALGSDIPLFGRFRHFELLKL